MGVEKDDETDADAEIEEDGDRFRGLYGPAYPGENFWSPTNASMNPTIAE